MSSVNNNRLIISNHLRRLQKLKEKQSLLGVNTPPEILIEIEDIGLEIERLRQVLGGVESEAQRKESDGSVTNIYIGGNFDGNLTVGNENRVIQNSFNKIASANIKPELRDTLKLLTEAVQAMNKALPKEQAGEVTEDLGRLVDEAIKPRPNKKWYSVSIEGLVKAAENLDKLGEPVISLSQKVLLLLAGGIMK